ncbi:hypothetical protein IT568_03480 [bacterium]|nr:hypothetical protein [bacterium]
MSLACSKWVSPKRTRSYPFARVYDTLGSAKKITIIPILKDEGAEGDRDFIQFDTISLMSLLDVYVIIAFYETAKKHKIKTNKITKQQFNNDFIVSKFKELTFFHSSALHWNLNEISNLEQTFEKAKKSYEKIENELEVKLHNAKGLDNFLEQLTQDSNLFKIFSRKKAKNAQERESLTSQPKEFLQTSSKTKLTITNYLGGKYFFTVDEIKIEKETLFLIEGKHSQNSLLPSENDVKDGLFKLIPYCNLENVKINEKNFKQIIPVLKLTSLKIQGLLNSDSSEANLINFLKTNKVSQKNEVFLLKLFKEAKLNNFKVWLGND